MGRKLRAHSLFTPLVFLTAFLSDISFFGRSYFVRALVVFQKKWSWTGNQGFRISREINFVENSMYIKHFFIFSEKPSVFAELIEVIKPIVKPIVEKPYDAWLSMINLVVQFSMWLNKQNNGSNLWFISYSKCWNFFLQLKKKSDWK